MIGQVRPFELDAARQRFSRDLLGGGLRLIRRKPGSRPAVDVGCGVAVVAHHHFRTERRRHLHERGQRHHVAIAVARLQDADVFRMRTERCVRLYPDLIHTAEAVEVVHVQRAQIDLHRVENIRHGHTELLGLHTVEVDIELGHVDLVVRERRAQLRRLRSLLQKCLRGAVECAIAQCATVFQLHLETAERTQAKHRRRREHRDERALHGRVLLVQRTGNRASRECLALAFVKRLERHEHNPRARRIRKAIDRQAREFDRAFHARLLERNRAHLTDHVFRTVERGAIGQLREADQVLLVLRGHEAARHDLAHQHCAAEQQGIDAHHQRLAVDHLGDAPAVVLRTAVEHLVEHAEKAAEDAVHAACQPVLRFVMALEQQCGKRGRQGQRVERGDHRRDRDGHRELFVELTREARHECERHEHGNQRQGDGDNRSTDLSHRLIGRLPCTEPRGDVPLDVFHHHDRIVDDDPDRQHHPEQ